MVTFSSNFLNYSSPFSAFLMARGVILFFPSPFALLPAISTSSAVRYSRTAAMQMALPTPTRDPIMISFSFLFILPTGKRRPAREAFDFPPAMAAIFDFPPLLLSFFVTATGLLLWVILSKEPVLASAWVSFFFSLWWTGARASGTGGGGGLLSKRLSGIRETASIIVELLYASFPTLSSVSRMLIEGNMLKTCALQPGKLTIGLFSRSSCNNCLKFLRTANCSIFSTLFAPNMRVCMCLDAEMYCRCQPGMLLKTMSNRMRAGRLGKFSRLTIPQSFSVSICRQRYLSNSCLMSAVKQPPKRTETMSSTQTICGGVPATWSRMASISF